MLLGRSWGARGPLLSVLKPDFGRFWAFLCACCVRRFSLNALSVPPLGQVFFAFGVVLRGLGCFSKTLKKLRKNNGFSVIFQSRSLNKNETKRKNRDKIGARRLLET